MRTAPQILHADTPLRLTSYLTISGHAGIEIREGDGHGEVGLTLILLHDLPSRVARLAEVGNAILAGRRVVVLPEDRDAEHAASPAGRLSAEIEGREPFPLVAELLDPTDARRAANLATGLPQAGDRVREREDAGALSLT